MKPRRRPKQRRPFQSRRLRTPAYTRSEPLSSREKEREPVARQCQSVLDVSTCFGADQEKRQSDEHGLPDIVHLEDRPVGDLRVPTIVKISRCPDSTSGTIF